MGSNSAKKLAILIDADSTAPIAPGCLLAEVAKYGTALEKRAYGDWASNDLDCWKNQLSIHSIKPVQQDRAEGSGSNNYAMIIDAMDLVYSNHFDGFCLMASDSDLSCLALRMRESGLVVYGLGNYKTPTGFVAACDKFVHFEAIILDRCPPPPPAPSPPLPETTDAGSLFEEQRPPERNERWQTRTDSLFSKDSQAKHQKKGSPQRSRPRPDVTDAASG